MTNKAYTFICHSQERSMFSSATDQVEYTIIDTDKSRDEMLESFRNFLIASGYSFKLSETIQVVDEDENYDF
jgi:hypothetical protein